MSRAYCGAIILAFFLFFLSSNGSCLNFSKNAALTKSLHSHITLKAIISTSGDKEFGRTLKTGNSKIKKSKSQANPMEYGEISFHGPRDQLHALLNGPASLSNVTRYTEGKVWVKPTSLSSCLRLKLQMPMSLRRFFLTSFSIFSPNPFHIEVQYLLSLGRPAGSIFKVERPRHCCFLFLNWRKQCYLFFQITGLLFYFGFLWACTKVLVWVSTKPSWKTLSV